jgi:hypothetical protein
MFAPLDTFSGSGKEIDPAGAFGSFEQWITSNIAP